MLIVEGCKRVGIEFAASSAFVSAISKCIRVREFDVRQFMHRIEQQVCKIRKCSTVADYVKEIDSVYNYGAHKTRIALAFLADEAAKGRAVSGKRKEPSDD